MPRTTLTKTTVPASPYTGAGAAITMTAADVANKNQFAASGNDLVIAHNSGASPATITITSAEDPYGRTEDITTEAIAAGAIRVFNLRALPGWRQSDGYIYLEASAADVKFGVLALP